MQELEKIFNNMQEIARKYYGKISTEEILEKFKIDF